MLLAQNDLLADLEAELPTENNYAEAAFKGLKIINLESTKMAEQGALYFIVAHRFGSIKNGLDDFFGLDSAITKLQLIYGITDGLNVGLARSSFQKTYGLHTSRVHTRGGVYRSYNYYVYGSRQR